MTASQPSPSDPPTNPSNNDSNLNLESINDYLPLRRSNRGKGKGGSSFSTHGSSSNLNDDKIQFCHVNGIEYRVGDHVYFEEADFEYFTIGLIEEIKLSRREKCSLVVKCFWRRRDIPESAKESLLEREAQESEDYDEFSLPSPELMKRELFVSDLQTNVFSQQLRGICSVIQLPDLTSATSLLIPDTDNNLPSDTFFYVYSYDPETKRLVSTRTEPKIGSAHQPEIPDLRKNWKEDDYASQDDVKSAYENYVISSSKRQHCENCPMKYISDVRLTWEELIWKPNEMQAGEDSLKTFLDAVRSIVAFLSFGGAKDDASSAENGLVLANCSATTQHAYNILYRCNFDIEEALKAISQEPFPIEDIPQHWSADEVRLFYHAMSIHGKDFHAIQRNFFNGSYQLPNSLINDDEAIENKAPRGNKRGYRRSNSVTKDETNKEDSKTDSESSKKPLLTNGETNELKKETESTDKKEEEVVDEFSKPSENPYTCYPGPTRSVKQLISFYYYWKKKNTQAGIIQQGNPKGRLPMLLPVNGIDKTVGQNGDSELNLTPSQAIDIAKKRRNQQTSFSKNSKFRKAGKASNNSSAVEASRTIKTMNVAQRKGWIAIHENRVVVKEQLASILRERSGLSEKILREEEENEEEENDDEDDDEDEGNETDEKNPNEEDNASASESSSVPKEEDFQPAVKIYLQKSPNDPLHTWSCKTNDETNTNDELDKTLEATNSGERTDSSESGEIAKAKNSSETPITDGTITTAVTAPVGVESKSDSSQLAKKNRICRNCHCEIEVAKQTTDSDSEEPTVRPHQNFSGQLKFLCRDCRVFLQRYGELRSPKKQQPETAEELSTSNDNQENPLAEDMNEKEKKNPLDETLEEVKPHSENVIIKQDDDDVHRNNLRNNDIRTSVSSCQCRNCKSTCSTVNSEGFCCKHENLVPMTVFDDCCCCQNHLTIDKCIDPYNFPVKEDQALSLDIDNTTHACLHEQVRGENYRSIKYEAYYLSFADFNLKTLIDEKYGIKRRHEDEDFSEPDDYENAEENDEDIHNIPGNKRAKLDEDQDDDQAYNDVDSENEDHLSHLIKQTAITKAKQINKPFIEKTWCRLNKIWDRKIMLHLDDKVYVNHGSCARTDLVYMGKPKESEYVKNKRIELYCQYASTALGPGVEQLPQPFKDISIANMQNSVQKSGSNHHSSSNLPPPQINGSSSPNINKLIPDSIKQSSQACNSAKLQEFAKVLNDPDLSKKDIGQLPPNASLEMVKACLLAMGINPNNSNNTTTSKANSNNIPQQNNFLPSQQHPAPSMSKGPPLPPQTQSQMMALNPSFMPGKVNLPSSIPFDHHHHPNQQQQQINHSKSSFTQPTPVAQSQQQVHQQQLQPPAQIVAPLPHASNNNNNKPGSQAPQNQNFEEFQKFLMNLGKGGSSANPEMELARLMAMKMFGQQHQPTTVQPTSQQQKTSMQKQQQQQPMPLQTASMPGPKQKFNYPPHQLGHPLPGPSSGPLRHPSGNAGVSSSRNSHSSQSLPPQQQQLKAQMNQQQSRQHGSQANNNNPMEAFNHQKHLDQLQKFFLSVAGAGNGNSSAGPHHPLFSQPSQLPPTNSLLSSNNNNNSSNDLEKARLMAMLSTPGMIPPPNNSNNNPSNAAAAANQMNALLQTFGFMNPPGNKGNGNPGSSITSSSSSHHNPHVTQSPQSFFNPDNLITKNKQQQQQQQQGPGLPTPLPPSPSTSSSSFLTQKIQNTPNSLEAVFASLKNPPFQQIPGFHPTNNNQESNSHPSSFLNPTPFSQHPKSMKQQQRSSVTPSPIHHSQNRPPHHDPSQFHSTTALTNNSAGKSQFQPTLSGNIGSSPFNSSMSHLTQQPQQHQQHQRTSIGNNSKGMSSSHNHRQGPSVPLSNMLHQKKSTMQGSGKPAESNNSTSAEAAFMTALLSNLASQQQQTSSGNNGGPSSNGQDVADALNAFLQHAAAAAAASNNPDNMNNRHMHQNNSMSSNQMMKGQGNRNRMSNATSGQQQQAIPNAIPPSSGPSNPGQMLHMSSQQQQQHQAASTTAQQNAAAMDYLRLMNQLAMAGGHPNPGSQLSSSRNQSMNRR